ncbi:cytochrome P450, partial [Nonomuraea sp. NPDC003754]
KIVQGAFTPLQAERWRGLASTIATELIDTFEPRTDLVEDYALPFSTRVICALLGVPNTDWPLFHHWTQLFLSTSDASAEARADAVANLVDYTTHLIADHRANPGNDLVDLLIQARDEGDRLTETQLNSMIYLLIMAGHESTALMIARGVYRLLWARQYDELVADPNLIESAVEEILRYDGPGSNGLLRLATCDIELPSGTIPAGSVVLPNVSAANHDPQTFPDPRRFDIRRYLDRAARPHFSFGHGPHHCLGVNLARVELQEALRALVTRLPSLQLAVAPAEVQWAVEGMGHRPLSLPVISG